MFAIKPACFGTGDKELTTICIWTCICHGKNTRFSVFQCKVLIIKSCTIDGPSTSAIVVGEVTSLAHEVWNHSMETASFITKAPLTSAKNSKILCCFGDNITPQLKI